MPNFDWNKNGKKDAFDRYMDIKVMSNVSENDDLDNLNIDEIDDIDFDTLDIDDDEYSWRSNYDYDFDTDINPEDYETEDEYLEALKEARLIKNYTKNETLKNNSNENQTKIYSYCKVMFGASNEKYDYLCGELKLNINDHVIVPFGNDNKQIRGIVIAVGNCLSSALPCDVNLMKEVIELSKSNENNQNMTTLKKDCLKDNIIYEDDFIKVSFIKWEYHDYLAGRARAGTFLFENKYDDRLCMYFKNISVGGFLNQEESMPTALSGKKKVITELSFVFDKKVPEHLKTYNEVEFTLCYGRIKEGYSASSLIQKPLIESDIIKLKI